MVRKSPYNYYDQIPSQPTKPMAHPNTITSADLEETPMPPTPPILRGPNTSYDWLVRQIGKYIKVEFLIGTNMLIDREGVLKEVGVNYIVLKESGTNDDLMCDMYSIKFVRIFDDQRKALLC